ncbi:MAG: hypothetical protein HY321_19785 [Armatimonadetes bacterium]|nr:hypothetical protein [Armatimonadota bacterium]
MSVAARAFIVIPAADPVASQPPARWAAAELCDALAARGVAAAIAEEMAAVPPGAPCVVAAGRGSAAAREVLGATGVAVADTPEALGLVPGTLAGRKVALACGSDARGLAYALLELADRVACEAQPLRALEIDRPVIERPANAIRSVTRYFSSDAWDKPWLYDRGFWRRYLTTLATHRFNRFSLATGLGYNAARQVRDAYLFFAYPFLVSVPGYDVRVPGLPDAERARNLEALRFISEEAARRGLHFQLALWFHGYEWEESPEANYVVEGLAPETHAAYCRDALRTVLQACPAIRGVTFRIHSESGVPDDSHGFWKTLFDGIAQCGRRVEIDMHAKQISQELIRVALATGMPVVVSPKYSAEHMGLPYQEASIRPSDGSLRYSFGNLLTEGRRYGILYRIWPGTQRLLLWGDPAMAAGYARASGFCGSQGLEISDPLSFRGRMGSAIPGDRDLYADVSLRPAGGDWEKHHYSYRIWGRLLYNPDADPETWRRYLRKEFGPATAPAEAALASASRVLPLITTAHLAAASNNGYWPEIYTNMPIVDETRRHPFGDNPPPRTFDRVSPLDPALFSSMDDFAAELLGGQASGRYTPLDVARWLDDFAEAASRHLTEAEARAAKPASPEFRRWALDVTIQAGLGRFFAGKLRAGVAQALYRRTGNPAALDPGLIAYRDARAAWAAFAERARGAYAADLTFGRTPHLRGHWTDRLPGIDADLGDMEKERAEARPAPDAPPIPAFPGEAPRVACRHVPPASFRRGEPVSLSLELPAAEAGRLTVEVRYRPVNQGVRAYRTLAMAGEGRRLHATLPAAETDTPFPLQYFFVLRDSPRRAWIYPGFGPELTNQPYYVVRQQGRAREDSR